MTKKTIQKLLKILFLILLLGFILGELYLRYFQGLANAPLYIESNKYEYMAAPNQDGLRFGNHYHYNSYSQRSEEPDSSKTIILGLGDSVLFGGVQSDQDSIATSLFTKAQEKYQMLNVSAGSWGPDNCSAYLKEKEITQLYVCGLAADICVYFSIIDALQEGFSCYFIDDASKALDTTEFKNLKKEMITKGIQIVTSKSL